jgi:hypothetical protein
VSNSSSSSFLIAYKEGLQPEDVATKLMREFMISNVSPFFEEIHGIARLFAGAQPLDAEDLEDASDYAKDFYNEATTRGLKIFSGSLGSDGDYDEQFAQNLKIDIVRKDIMLKSDGRF